MTPLEVLQYFGFIVAVIFASIGFLICVVHTYELYEFLISKEFARAKHAWRSKKFAKQDAAEIDGAIRPLTAEDAQWISEEERRSNA